MKWYVFNIFITIFCILWRLALLYSNLFSETVCNSSVFIYSYKHSFFGKGLFVLESEGKKKSLSWAYLKIICMNQHMWNNVSLNILYFLT